MGATQTARSLQHMFALICALLSAAWSPRSILHELKHEAKHDLAHVTWNTMFEGHRKVPKPAAQPASSCALLTNGRFTSGCHFQKVSLPGGVTSAFQFQSDLP